MAVLIPLAFLRRLDSLRHTSYVALFAVGAFSFLNSELPPNIPFRIPCRHCDILLLPPPEGYDQTWRNLAHPLYAELRLHVSSTGLRFHLCAECESFIVLSSMYI
jgi:hypothetical protein